MSLNKIQISREIAPEKLLYSAGVIGMFYLLRIL